MVRLRTRSIRRRQGQEEYSKKGLDLGSGLGIRIPK